MYRAIVAKSSVTGTEQRGRPHKAALFVKMAEREAAPRFLRFRGIRTSLYSRILPFGFEPPIRQISNKSGHIKRPLLFENGGEGGIRTLGTVLPYTHFPGVLLKPLGHLSGGNTAHPLRRAQGGEG